MGLVTESKGVLPVFSEIKASLADLKSLKRKVYKDDDRSRKIQRIS